MVITIIFIAVALLLLGYFLYKRGDQDGDGDIDIKDLTISAKEINEELSSRAGEVLEEVKDVISAIKGKPTKAKLNKLTKQQLVDSAKADHGVDLDIKVKKSVLVNKVYSLYI
jgi:hypothetical protein